MNEMQCTAFLSIVLVVVLVFAGARPIAAQEPNVGLLRVVSVEYPRQVAPSKPFSVVIDVEYAIHENATVKAALFEGSLEDLGSRFWESAPVVLAGGGDQLWTVNLTAPSTEQKWSLTVIAYYLDAGKWTYHTDSYSGPGYAEITLKIATLAELIVDLKIPNLPVTVDNSTQSTSAEGQVKLQLPVGQTYYVTIPPAVEFDNSTRLEFAAWQDGYNSSQRAVKLDGDSNLAGTYKRQYLLQVNSNVPGYANSTWYDAGSNVSLTAKPTAPLSWPMRLLGLAYVFKGWTGAVNSNSAQLNVTMNGPKVVTANFAVDYTLLVIPAIIVAGVLGAIALLFARRRLATRPSAVKEKVVIEESSSKVCGNCGKPVEEDWTHCIHCGKSLNPSEPVQGGQS